MRVSAVVLSFNSAAYIEQCVRSLAAAFSASGSEARDETWKDEIWVVENGSSDASPQLLAELEAELPGLLRVIYLPRNTGTTVSRNLALRRAEGRYILVVDSDVIVPEGILEALIERLEDDPRVGIIAPRLTYPDGRFQLSTDVFPTVPRKLRRLFSLRRLERRSDDTPGGVRTVDYAISAFWLLRRAVLDRVGLLDENIFYSPEDVDYCLRVWAAGFTVAYDASVSAVHDAQEISRGFPLKRSSLSHAKGLVYYFLKHGYALGRSRLYRRIDRNR